ncbi:MAG: hypothetical protein ACI4EN_10505 [Butyrivibrio sp.]
MKIKYIALITGVLIICAACIGLFYKSSYKDFNSEESPLDQFAVGLLNDELAERQIKNMEENLGESNIIIAAKCEEKSYFRFRCLTQKVTVQHVFKGEGVSEGDVIDVARSGSQIFLDALTNEMPNMNISFVREMYPGETYLIFLDYRLNTGDKENIFIQSDDFIVAPIFCYNKTESVPYESIIEGGDFAEYKTVKDSEFFLMSEESIEMMYQLKNKLISQYSY